MPVYPPRRFPSKALKDMIKTMQNQLLILSIMIAGCSLASLSSCNTDEPDEPVEISTFENDPALLSTLFLQSDEILSINSDTENFYVNATGLAGHRMLVGISMPNDHVPVPHDYDSWAVRLKPEYADEEISLENTLQSAPVAIAINGIPIYNSLNLSDEFTGEDGELDDFGGHAGTEDEYHYHLPPLHLQNEDQSPFAYALDGFPIYGNLEPDGSPLLTLDDYNGHLDEEGHFHYHALSSQDYILKKFRGKVELIDDGASNEVTGQPEATLFRTQIFNYLTKYSETDKVEITEMLENEDESGYSIIYQVNDEEGTLTYFWDADGFYTFTYTEPDGTNTTQLFER